jgi:hypothetical protein
MQRLRKVSLLYLKTFVTAITFLEGKRSKLEAETSTSGRSTSQDQIDRPENKKLGLVTTESFASGHPRPEHSPSIGSARLPAGASLPSKPTSPGTYPISGYNSPRIVEYSPKSASPRSMATPKEAVFDSSANHLARDFRGQLDLYSYSSTPYTASHHHPPPASGVSHPYPAHYQGSVDHPSRRPTRDYGVLPPLVHEDTTLSSESSHSGYSLPSGFHAQNPPIDATKSSRTLPQPIPSIGPTPSQLDRPLPSGPSPPILPPPHDYRAQGPLAALVRAGELAAIVAEDEAKQEGSP